jgi:hypothetical protein
MRYRRLIEHLRRQDGMAIAIDLVIVVVGVFIGIQVANWNDSLADERLGRAYAARLAEDLERDLASRRLLVDYYGAVLDSVERTDALLAQPDADPKALVIAAYRASEINYRAPSRATWDEIVSSGDTGLLPREVATSAANYFAFDTARNVLDTLSNSAYRRLVRTTLPLALQQALRAGCSDVRDDDQDITGFMPDCQLDVSTEIVLAAAAALRTNPELQASLRHQYSDVFSAHANIRGDAIAIERALAALKGLPLPAKQTQ